MGALASSTTWGIQAESDRERLRFLGGARERRCLPGAVPARACTTATEPEMERPLLLGHDSDREVQPMQEVLEVGAQQ